MKSKSAIIIGSGVAGMATAIRLAVQGYKVKVYEKNTSPGGKLSAFEKDGYLFDAGPSLFTEPQNIEELFELAGESIEDYFLYESVEIACTYFYENGKTIKAYTNAALFAEELREKVSEDPKHIIKYLKRSEKAYNNIGIVFLGHSLQKRKTWFNKRVIKALLTLRFSYLFQTLNKHNQSQFSVPETVQLFNRFATYNGSDPYKAPGMLSLIPNLEHNQGTFYPMGGMISIADALYRLAIAKGVQFYFNTPVQRIIHHEGKICGVVANDENISADIVVSNADVLYTYKYMLNDPPRAKKILKHERSSSAIVFFWGVKRTFPQLQLHNIFFSADYKNEFDNIFNKKNLSTDPTVYVNITSKMEPAAAPGNCENWFVMVNAPANTGQDWDKLKKELRLNIISKLNRMLGVDMETLIETEQSMDPLMIESQTASYMGSLYGTSSNSKLSAFFRQPNFSGTIKGLYFCGGSVHPGGGIPLCLKSAKIVSDIIQGKKNK